MNKYNLLVIDDDEDILSTLEMGLAMDYQLFTAPDRAGALSILRTVKIDLLLLDLRLGDEDGLALHREMQLMSPETVVILLTAYADIDTAVSAMQQGISDVITKPISLAELKLRLDKNLRLWQNRQAIASFKSQLAAVQPPIVARSRAMREVMAEVRTLANLPNTVLITGESGTGKELVARALHAWGRYAERPFVALNCSAIPDNLIESELFGTERGAYTGAVSLPGKIEHAGEGVILLDEIGDMPLALQSSLLRVLDGYTFCRLGSNREIPVRCRFVAATNRDLPTAVVAGGFRKDLFYRLNIVSIHIPPLRERREDIPEMVEYFLRYYERQYGITREIPPQELERLCQYDFPGNARELRSIVERYILIGRFGISLSAQPLPGGEEEVLPLDEYVRCYVARVYRLCDGDTKKAAMLLGITEKTVKKKLREYEKTTQHVKPAIIQI